MNENEHHANNRISRIRSSVIPYRANSKDNYSLFNMMEEKEETCMEDAALLIELFAVPELA